MLERVYVSGVRVLRSIARALGVLGMLERSQSPPMRHLRSQFAIYDAEDLARLDLPWWTYGAIGNVERFLAGRDATVFEYGAGASTVWLAKRARQVVSVEHDAEYLPVVERLVSDRPNVTLMLVEPTPGSGSAPSGRKGYSGVDFADYVRAIERAGGPFDLVVIDGRARLSCLDPALAHLKPGGIVLFDDLNRKRYSAVLARDDIELELHRGAKPADPLPSMTGLIRPRS